MLYYPAVLVPCSSNAKWCLVGDQLCPSAGSCESGQGFCLVEYERALERIDLVEATVVSDFIVIEKYGLSTPSTRGFYLKAGDKVCLQEVSAAYVTITKGEGDPVREGEKIGYTLSSKGNLKTIRSSCNGIITLVINITWEMPEKYVVVVVKEDELRQVFVREGTGGCSKERPR